MGSFLLVLGLLTALAVSFGAGVGAGRRWPRLLPSLGGAPMVKADRQDMERGPGRSAGGRSGLGAASPGERPGPELTFYHELTAPLAAPPPAAKSRPERVERSTREAQRPDTSRPDAPKPERRLPERMPEPRFTVQVGAYKTREQAEAVQARLIDGGYDAYVSDFEGPPGARFRVRVGTFVTRDEARQTAERLAAERKTATFVTTR